MSEFYNRSYELELLKRKYERKLNFDKDCLYYKDIKNAWSLEGVIDAPEEIQSAIYLLPIDIMVLSDTDLTRKVTELHNKRLLHETSRKILDAKDYQTMHALFTGTKLNNTATLEKVDIDNLADCLLTHQFNIADGNIESALKTDTTLDSFDNGFRNEYILIAARPSVGKSIAGLEIAINVAKQGKKVAFFSFEMSKEALMTRILFNLARVSANNPKNRMLTSDQREKLKAASQEIKKLDIHIFDQPCDVHTLRAECIKTNYDIVIVDYLQKIRPHRHAERRIIVEEVSSTLQNLPKEIKAPVICISSLTRPDGKDENKPPNMMELKETSNLEFDADVIILMHRRKENGVYQKEIELMCTKNRNGQTGYKKAEIHGSVYHIK